jgi:phosphatidylinositol alpha-1,6-mannosyltransferase
MRLRDITPSIESLNDLAVMYISPIVDPYEDYALTLSDGVTIDSVAQMEAVRARGLPSLCPRMELIPEGVDTDTFNPDNEDRSILDKYGVGGGEHVLFSISRLAARKGYFKLLELFSKLRQERSDVKLVIGGTGPQERALRLWVERNDMGRDVVFTGPLPFPDLKALYATSDVFVFYSLWEGQGLVIMETMASGTPVVSTNVGGLPEMVDLGKDGYYFEEGDDGRALEQINELLDDPVKRREFGKRGRKKMVEVWDWRHRVARIESMMMDIIGDKGTPPGPAAGDGD